MMLLKCYTQYTSKFEKLTSGYRTGKCQFSFQSQRKAMPKNVQITIQVCSFKHASKVKLKIIQARLQKYENQECPNVQARFFRKGRNQRSNCQHPLDRRESKGIKKNLLLLHSLC